MHWRPQHAGATEDGPVDDRVKDRNEAGTLPSHELADSGRPEAEKLREPPPPPPRPPPRGGQKVVLRCRCCQRRGLGMRQHKKKPPSRGRQRRGSPGGD